MSDPRERDVTVTLRIRDLAGNECVRRIPDDAQRGVVHGGEEPRGLRASRDIARVLVLDADDERTLAGGSASSRSADATRSKHASGSTERQ